MAEWELSKENVLPQKKGRDIQVLNSCLQSSAAQVEEQRRRLMLDVESYAGDDPLQPWLKIIKWAKQSYPTGGSQSPILSLLESCARKFKGDERYKSDKRYLTVWVQYADCCSDPSDIFAFLEANEIGQEHALYYEACATFFESRRNFSRANDIYELGVARQAQPLGRLQNMYKGFLERMNRRHKRQLREEQEQRGSFNEQGQPRTFGQKLTGRGPVRPAQQPGRLLQRSPLQRVNNAALPVFVDPEFGGSSSRQTATASHSSWQSLATDAERRKENVQRPMKWTDAKIPSQSNPTSQPSFEVFVDQEFVSSKEQAKALSPHIPATLKLRHDDIGRRRESTLKSKPLQHFCEGSPSVGGSSQQHSVEVYGYNVNLVSEDGLDRSFEEFRAMKWQQNRKHSSQQSRLSHASLQPAEPASRGAAVLDWLNKSPVIMLPDSANQGGGGGLPFSSRVGERGLKDIRSPEEFTWGGEQILNAHEAQRKSTLIVPIVFEKREKESGAETFFPGNGDETIAIRRIAQQAISLGVDPEVGNMAVRHPGLVEPTINTKEAMDDINSMFQSDLPCERKRRSNGSSRGNKKVAPIGAGMFSRDSKQSFNVYMDEELEEQNAAKTSQSLEVGIVADEEALAKAFKSGVDTTESNGKDRTQGFQVYVDDAEVTQIRTHKLSSVEVDAREELPRTLNTRDGTTGFKLAGKRESFRVYLDEELGGLNSVKRGQEVLETNPSSLSLYGGEDLPRRLKFGEDTVEFKAESLSMAGKTPASKPVYAGEARQLTGSSWDVATIGGYSEDTKASLHSAKGHVTHDMQLMGSVALDKAGGSVYEEFGEQNTLNLDGNVVANKPDSTQVLRVVTVPRAFSPTVQMYKDESNCDASVKVASSLASLALHCDKENTNMQSPNLTSGSRMSTDEGDMTSADVQVLNPWDEALLVRLLNGLDPPLYKCEEYHLSNTKYPGAPLSSLRKAPRGKTVELAGRAYYIKSCTGQGAFAQVYLADDYEGDDEVVLKVQKPGWPWEFYIYSQLHKRIPLEERASYGQALRMHCYSDYSIMVCKYGEHGTLQDVINAYLAKGEKMDEVLCIYYTIEMLRMLENLHGVGLIHGDFKPDNLLIRKHTERFQNWSPERPGCWQHEGLCLIDWGRSLDLSLFPPGTQFLADCKTEGFQCIEMLEERPWTYQIDTYGLCVVVHCLLHGSYLEVTKGSGPSASGPKYQPRAAYKRYWNAGLWRNLFDTLLNIDSCERNPPLRPLRKSFEDYLLSNPALVSKLSLLLMRQNILMSKR